MTEEGITEPSSEAGYEDEARQLLRHIELSVGDEVMVCGELVDVIVRFNDEPLELSLGAVAHDRPSALSGTFVTFEGSQGDIYTGRLGRFGHFNVANVSAGRYRPRLGEPGERPGEGGSVHRMGSRAEFLPWARQADSVGERNRKAAASTKPEDFAPGRAVHSLGEFEIVVSWWIDHQQDRRILIEVDDRAATGMMVVVVIEAKQVLVPLSWNDFHKVASAELRFTGDLGQAPGPVQLIPLNKLTAEHAEGIPDSIRVATPAVAAAWTDLQLSSVLPAAFRKKLSGALSAQLGAPRIDESTQRHQT